MENQNKKWIITTIILSIIILILSGYIVYDKLSNQENNNCSLKEENKQATLNDELKNTTSFALRERSTDYGPIPMLVAIDNEGKETIIYDFLTNARAMDSVEYYYEPTEAKIYLSIRSFPKGEMRLEHPKYELATIDLSKNVENYELKTLTELKRSNYSEAWAESITKIGDYIYLGNTNIYKVSLKDYSIEKMDATSTSRMINVFNYSSNLIYNENKTIYKYNVKTGTKEVIVEDALIGYLYKNQLIYSRINSDPYQTVYYSYNLDSKETKIITSENAASYNTFEFAVPYKETYLYLDGTKDTLFHYENDKEFEIKCSYFKDKLCRCNEIDSYLIYSNYIKVIGTLNDELNGNVEDILRYEMIVDLDNQNIISLNYMEDLLNYMRVTYIK